MVGHDFHALLNANPMDATAFFVVLLQMNFHQMILWLNTKSTCSTLQ